MKSDTLTIEPLVDEAIPGQPVSPAASYTVVGAPTRLGELLSDYPADAHGRIEMPFGELLQIVYRVSRVPSYRLRRQKELLQAMLQSAGYGSAPDMVVDRRWLTRPETIVLYPLGHDAPPMPARRSALYMEALLAVRLTTLVFSPMSPQEIEEVEQFVAQIKLTERVRQHFWAMLRWYDSRRRALDAPTKALAAKVLTHQRWRRLYELMLRLAAARGENLTAEQITRLGRVITYIGKGDECLHTDLHRARCAPIAPTKVKTSAGLHLDRDRIFAIQADTEQARALLAEVLDSDPKPQAAAAPQAAAEPALLRRLLERDEWPENEVAALVPAGMTVAVALERVNDLAISLVDDTVAEMGDDGIIYVTTDYKDAIDNILDHES